jgi:hypothetical protein
MRYKVITILFRKELVTLLYIKYSKKEGKG